MGARAVTGRYGDGSPGRPAERGDAPHALPAQQRAETVGERVRREATGPPCTCTRPDVLDPESGRCQRCWGQPREDA
jgi:hypothetical protein